MEGFKTIEGLIAEHEEINLARIKELEELVNGDTESLIAELRKELAELKQNEETMQGIIKQQDETIQELSETINQLQEQIATASSKEELLEAGAAEEDIAAITPESLSGSDATSIPAEEVKDHVDQDANTGNKPADAPAE